MSSIIMNEQWAKLDYGGGRYEISNLGQLRRWGPVGADQEGWQYMRGFTGPRGTLVYSLGQSTVQAHRLVAQHFLNGGTLTRGQWVRHRNGDVRDNRPENLEIFRAGNPRWNREVMRDELMAELRAEGWTPPPGRGF